MKKNITTQLFIALLGMSILVIITVISTITLSIHHRFNKFTEHLDKRHAEAVTAALAEVYRQYGSWHVLQKNPQLWQDILYMGNADAGPNETEESKEDTSSLEELPAAHNNLQKPLENNEPFAANQKTNIINKTASNQIPHNNSQSQQRIPQMRQPSFKPPVPPQMYKRLDHWSLIDQNGSVIAGNKNPPANHEHYQIMIQNKLVGELIMSKEQRVMSAEEISFFKDQIRASLLIMLFSVLGALLAAIWLTKRLVAPIKIIASGTQQLTDGHFDTHINLNRDDELGQLANDFNLLAQTLKSNQQLRRQFIADISHELRTPLAILRGELEAIADGIRQPTPDAIESLQQEVSGLTHLVDDLYQLALSETGQLQYSFSPVNLKLIIEDGIERFTDKLLNAKLSVNLTCLKNGTPTLNTSDFDLMGDHKRLNQLITNLFENSIRYTDANGCIYITLNSTHTGLTFLFEDTAPGVSLQEAERLFERFYRVEHSRNRATGGAGLGLSICYTIVQAHKGTIQASPSHYGGLCLDIQLPQNANKA